jgi:hypothetical protein
MDNQGRTAADREGTREREQVEAPVEVGGGRDAKDPPSPRGAVRLARRPPGRLPKR